VVRRVGVLEVLPGLAETLSAPLRALGWVEGQNLLVDRRHTSSLEALGPAAEELVRAKVDVIVANGPNPTRAAMHATTTIPIVCLAYDPVASGLVASLARPGGNVTGFSASSNEEAGKLLSLLKEMLPALRRIGVLETSGNPQFRVMRKPLQDACRTLALDPVFAEVAAVSDVEGAVATLKGQQAQALLMYQDSFALAHGPQIVSAAMRRGLPTITGTADFVRNADALASFTASRREVHRRLAYYVDRILRGAKPADLPVEQPTEFELVINLRTARALGLTVPQAVLVSAYEVIR
jgi:putative ABC transport system substrate-binding protein